MLFILFKIGKCKIWKNLKTIGNTTFGDCNSLKNIEFKWADAFACIGAY